MDEQKCIKCHIVVRQSDYFCFNCGASLHPAPPSISIESQIMTYLGSFFLPPMGIIWGIRYIRVANRKSKVVGYIAVTITILAILLYTIWVVKIMNGVSEQMNQLQNLQGF